jgi:hypothetical protein
MRLRAVPAFPRIGTPCALAAIEPARLGSANLAATQSAPFIRVVRQPVSLECPWFRGLPADASAVPPAVSLGAFDIARKPGCLNSGKGEVFEFGLPGRTGRDHSLNVLSELRQPRIERVRLARFLGSRGSGR